VTEHVTNSEQETVSIGRELARQLRAGDVVLLSGPLGAGKTAFVRGLAEGLGADPDDVSSPTFAIIQEYRGRVLLQHVDLYRLSSVEVDDLALLELGADAVMAIEWPERWVSAPSDVWCVSLEVVDEHRRRITTQQG
jgi:tRNA threonylcarbamoyladenosine biosynthesis protein TsaE